MTTILTYAFAPGGISPIIPSEVTVSFTEGLKNITRTAFREWEKWGDFINVEVPFQSGISPDGISTRFIHQIMDGPGIYAASETTPNYNSHPSLIKSIIFVDSEDSPFLPNNQLDILMKHEIGHGVAGNQEHNEFDTNALLHPFIDIHTGNGIPIASEKTAVANMYGAPVTFINKMAHGKLLGDLWSLYKGMGNTAPDASGLFYWCSEIQRGNKTLLDCAWGFSTIGITNEQFVNNLYNRILGRAPDSSGLSFYVGSLNNGTKTRPQIAVELTTSAEAATYRQGVQTAMWLS